MTPAQQSLLAVGLASALPVVGTLLFAAGAQRTVEWIPRLVPFAVGAMVGAALFHLIPEAAQAASPARVALSVLAGVAAFVILDRVTHGKHDESVAAREPARAVLSLSIASDALHNLIDGVLVATTFLTEPTLGVITAVAVATHELPRELGTFALCVAGGLSIRRALVVNALTAALALVGALTVIALGSVATDVAKNLLPFAAGAFLYLAGSIVWLDRARLRTANLRMRYGALIALGVLVASAARH